MTERNAHIQRWISDQLALEEHILEAIERQRDDEKVRENLEANRVIIEIERVLKQHRDALRSLSEQYGAKGESIVKKAVTELLGVAAGLYDKVRDYKVSRMLRDDYTALSLAAMGYTTFHTFGLAVKEERVANLAVSHLKDITPLLVEISKVITHVAAKETAEEVGFPVDASVGAAAERNTQGAWANQVTRTHQHA